jgi:hypothetical protein
VRFARGVPERDPPRVAPLEAGGGLEGVLSRERRRPAIPGSSGLSAALFVALVLFVDDFSFGAVLTALNAEAAGGGFDCAPFFDALFEDAESSTEAVESKNVDQLTGKEYCENRVHTGWLAFGSHRV